MYIYIYIHILHKYSCMYIYTAYIHSLPCRHICLDRSGTATLADQVRECDDCYFHNILCVLRFRGVLLSEDVFQKIEHPVTEYASKFLLPHLAQKQEASKRLVIGRLANNDPFFW